MAVPLPHITSNHARERAVDWGERAFCFVTNMKRKFNDDGILILNILTRPICEYLYPSDHKSMAVTCSSMCKCIATMYTKEKMCSGCAVSIEEPVQALGDRYICFVSVVSS